ncbi:carbohydrate ABC transporter permease [Aestuariivirga sp.]|uniref:carbohydrate ABC transporter permease n=1 Tax=Aestuariivirga sp. TaxID=2650926 RepID=UPI003BADADF0
MTDAALSTSTLRTARRRSPFRRKAFPYLLVAPAVIYLLAITLYPGIFALWRSFYAGRFQLNFVGFQQYQELFRDEAFWHSLTNTLIIGGITLAVEFVVAMSLAALVYRDPFVRGWRILFLLPMLFMPSAVAYLWKLLFNDGRVISDLLMRIGLVDHNIDFMGFTWLARGVLVVTDVWQWVPFLFIIFVAALQGQDKEIEEAARLDGARWGQIFFAISLPLMRPVIAIALVLRGIDILTMFASPHIITQGSPGGDTETVSYFIYRTGFKSFEFGYASAASVVVLILTIILAQSFVRRFFKSGRD